MCWGIPEQHISTIYNAVSTDIPGALPEEVAVLPHPLIVSVGRLVPWKGFHALIEAVATLRTGGINASLAIVGDGPERLRLMEEAQERLGIEGVFLGKTLSHPETLAVMKNADAFVLNSHYEGFSHTLIEALFLGLPVIATRVGGNVEVLTDGHNGLLIPVGDTAHLAHALTCVLRDRSLSTRLRESAKESAQRFSERAMIDSTISLLSPLASPMQSRDTRTLKVLMISGDRNMLTPGTDAHKRLMLQREAVGRLDLFVWPSTHSWREIMRAAASNQYDVVTTQDPFWRGFLARRAARRAGAKLNVQVHTDVRSQSYFRHSLAERILRHADSVRVVSESIKRQVERMGVQVPVHVVPVYVDTAPFRAIKREAHSGKVILWIGRFEAEKDPLGAVRVLEKVRAAGVDAKLIMLGAGSLVPRLLEAAKVLPIELPGWQDPKPYFAVADVVLNTSPFESWGASMIEALAARVPVVAPDVGVAREAGATVVRKESLAEAVGEVLVTKARGTLKLKLSKADEWVKQWRASLV